MPQTTTASGSEFFLRHVVIQLAIVVGFTGCSESPGTNAAGTKELSSARVAFSERPDGEVVTAEYFQGALSADALAELAKHEHLREITFMEISSFPAEAAAQLGEIASLRELTFIRCEIGDDELKQMEKAQAIESLSLTHTKITRNGIAGLGTWKNLERLAIGDGISVDQLVPLPELTNLTTLELKSVDANIQKISGLETLTNLKVLSIPDAVTTDDDLASLPDLPNLEELNFTPFDVSDAGCHHLARLKGLKQLSLSQSQISDAGLAELGAMPNLERLNLNGCINITDAGIEKIADLPNLQSIDLSNCKGVTNESLAQIARMPKLADINLVSSGVTGDRLEDLAASKSLQTVSVTLERCTEEQAAELETQRPDCKVQRIRTTPQG